MVRAQASANPAAPDEKAATQAPPVNSQPEPNAIPDAPANSAEPEPPQQPLTFGATGRMTRRAATTRHLESEEARSVPGAFGDPFRVLDTLPGVVPAISGLPYVYVRGSPPAGTVYYYDDIQVPALFHLALGPAVVHPAVIGPVNFYPAVAPARYGRYTGGVLAGERGLPPTAAGGELELRLVDVMGRFAAPVGDGGSLSISGRYGYPGPLLSLLSPTASLAYWDYQTRLALPLNDHDRVELTWFGSYDGAHSRSQKEQSNDVTLEFHRAELRLIRQRGNFEYGSALQLAYERSSIGTLLAESARLGPRVYALWRGEAGLRVRAGADFFGATGKLHPPVDGDTAGVRFQIPAYANVAARSIGGAYAELSLPLLSELTLEAGLRGDLWLTGSRSESALDPRLNLVLRAGPNLEFHVAGGLGHQPSVFLLPLPALADIGLEHGLQQALQSEAGMKLRLPAGIRFETQLYLQHLRNLILPDLVLAQSLDCDLPTQTLAVTSRCNRGYPRAKVWAYGLETFLYRAPTETLSGWFSYTLGWANGHADEGYDFTPSFDVRHLLNLVLQYRLGGGFSAGARVHYRSGKVASTVFVREHPVHYEQRLPGFFRADASLSYGWTTNWGKLRASLEWFNVTLSREAIDIECRDGIDVGKNPKAATPCGVKYAPALFFPNLGLRAEY